MFGLPAKLDNQLSNRAVVQSSGYAYSIKRSELEKQIDYSPQLLKTLLIFQQLRMFKISQMGVCSRLHTIEQQLCRVLLNALDYSESTGIKITQQSIANKLNVRRESIATSAARIQHEGIIKVVRGKVTVLDRSALERKTCECYQVTHNEVSRLLNCQISQLKNYTSANVAVFTN